MKILMFGRGVISSIYGWALENAGHEVDFYVRPGRKERISADIKFDIYDLRQKGKDQHRREIWPTRMREELPVDHDYEMIFLSVQHYQFDSAAQFLATRASGATILVFSNFWTDPQESASILPQEQLAWGFPAAGGGIDAQGNLRGALLKHVEFGTFGTDPTWRERAARDVFRNAGFDIKEHRNFRDWLWVHFARNAGITAQTAIAGSFGSVMRDFGQAKQMIHNVREVQEVLLARGVTLKGQSELAPFRLPVWLGALIFNLLFQFSAALRASVDGHANPEEIRRFYNDFMDESERQGVRLPRMEAIRPLIG